MKYIIAYSLVFISAMIAHISIAQSNTFTIDIIATQEGPSVVNVFDSLIYERLTKMELSVTGLNNLPKSDKIKIALACKKATGSVKANKPNKYQIEFELDQINKPLDSINLCVFDIEGSDDCSKKNKKKFRNFSIAPTKKRHREIWAIYEYSFIVYSFKNKNGAEDPNASTTSRIVAMSKPFYVISERRKKQKTNGF